MPLDHLGPYVDANSSHHRHSVESIITDIFQRHGLIPTTDVEQVSPYGGGPLGLTLDTEAIRKLREDKAAWDDTPGPDKLVNILLEIACRQKKDRPDPTTVRMVGIVPATNRAVILVVYSFFPIAAADIADLRKVGRWALGVRDERGIPSQFSGDIHDHEDLKGALELVQAICAKHKEELKLESLVPSMLDDGAHYRSVPARYARPGQRGILLAGADGELASAPPELTPEQLAGVRKGAIAMGDFDDFRAMYPDQPPMTPEEEAIAYPDAVSSRKTSNNFPPLGSSTAPPTPLTPP
jgi:hypothetical protein